MDETGNTKAMTPNKLNSVLQKEIKKYEDLNKKLLILSNEVSENAETYTKNKVKIEKLIGQADNFYKKIFIPIKEEITDKNTGLKSILSKSKQQQKDINNNILKINKSHKEYLEILASIKSVLTNAKLTEKKIDISYGKSVKTEEQISTVKDNVYTIQKQINGIQQQSEKTYAQIDSCHNESIEICKKIEINFEKSDSTIKDMVTLESEAKNFVQKIADQYGIASNTSLAGAFEEKRRELGEELGDWHKRVRIWSLVLFFAIIVLFLVQWLGSDKCDLNDLHFDFYLRFLFVTPLLFYLLFCNNQYNKTRANLDKYSFKYAIARSLEAHTDLLTRNFSDNIFRDRVLEFSLNSLGKIYDKPYIDDVEMAKAINVKDDCNAGFEKALSNLMSFDKSETLKFLKSITSILEKK